MNKLSPEAYSTMLGMVEYCLNQRVCMGMDEGFKCFDTEEEHGFVKELRALLAAEPSNKCARCGASTVDGCNYLGCHFLESANGAPVVERQEPVAPMPEMVDRRDGWPEGYLESDDDWCDNNPEAVGWLADNHAAIRAALYAEQPAPTDMNFSEWLEEHGREGMAHELGIEDLMEGAWEAGAKSNRRAMRND